MLYKISSDLTSWLNVNLNQKNQANFYQWKYINIHFILWNQRIQESSILTLTIDASPGISLKLTIFVNKYFQEKNWFQITQGIWVLSLSILPLCRDGAVCALWNTFVVKTLLVLGLSSGTKHQTYLYPPPEIFIILPLMWCDHAVFAIEILLIYSSWRALNTNSTITALSYSKNIDAA